RYDLEPFLREQSTDALTQQHRVVGKDYAHRRPRAAAERVPGRWEVARKVVAKELEEPFGLRQTGEPVAAEVEEGKVREEVTRRVRAEHLAAVTGRGDAGGAVDVESRVALLAQDRVAGVDADTNAHARLGRPAV